MSAPRSVRSSTGKVCQPKTRASASGRTRGTGSQKTSKSQPRNKPIQPKESSLDFYPKRIQPILVMARLLMSIEASAQFFYFYSVLTALDSVTERYETLAKDAYALARAHIIFKAIEASKKPGAAPLQDPGPPLSNPHIIAVVGLSIANLRLAIKKVARVLVFHKYDLDKAQSKNPECSDAQWNAIREIKVNDLIVESGTKFYYAHDYNDDGSPGSWNHDCCQAIITHILFHKRGSMAQHQAESFGPPVTIQLIAFGFYMSLICLKEWADGFFKADDLDVVKDSVIYENILTNLRRALSDPQDPDFAVNFDLMRHRWWNEGLGSAPKALLQMKEYKEVYLKATQRNVAATAGPSQVPCDTNQGVQQPLDGMLVDSPSATQGNVAAKGKLEAEALPSTSGSSAAAGPSQVPCDTNQGVQQPLDDMLVESPSATQGHVAAKGKLEAEALPSTSGSSAVAGPFQGPCDAVQGEHQHLDAMLVAGPSDQSQTLVYTYQEQPSIPSAAEQVYDLFPAITLDVFSPEQLSYLVQGGGLSDEDLEHLGFSFSYDVSK